MGCSEARRQLAGGTSDARLETHLAECADCAAFACEGHRRALGAGEVEVDANEVERLLRATGDLLRAEAGFAAWSKSRSTRLRLALLLIAAGAIPLGYAALVPRADLSVYPTGRLLAFAVVLAALVGLSGWMRLRPLHRPSLPRAAAAAVVLGGLIVIALDCLLPEAHGADPASLAGAGADLFASAAGCLFGGMAIAVPAYVTVNVLDRAGAGWSVPSVFGALLAGLAGYLMLHLHCPLVPRLHLVLGHASVPLAFLAVYAVQRRCVCA